MTKEEKNKINITSPAGFRDFYPEDFAKVRFVLETMRRVSKEFGYVEYHTPAVELLKLYELKSGEGLISEIFKVKSRSGQDLVLIPELTPSLTRLLAAKQQNYTKPIRWFSLPKCYRDETLQRGRVKEFWQYNIDMLGMEDIYADAEIITILIKIITECGLNKDQFVVLINDREFMQQFIEAMGITDFLTVIQTFDKKDKILQKRIEMELRNSYSKEEAKEIALTIRHVKEVDERIFTKIPKTKDTEKIVKEFQYLRKDSLLQALKKLKITNKQAEVLFELSEISAKPDLFIKKAKKLFPGENAEEALDNLSQLAELLNDFGMTEYIRYDGSLARGLDYYTGIIFEAWSRDSILPRAIAGGGRYADLVETLGGKPLTGQGFGFGETVLMELMDEYDIPYPEQEICEVYITPIKLDNLAPVIELSNKLRAVGFKTILNPFKWKIKRHFENAEKQNVEWMIIVGKKDLANNSVTLRNIISGEQEVIPLKQIVKTIQKKFK